MTGYVQAMNVHNIFKRWFSEISPQYSLHEVCRSSLPSVVEISRQYMTALTNDHVVWPEYVFIPPSIAACNSSSNFRSLIRAIDFQSSSLKIVFGCDIKICFLINFSAKCVMMETNDEKNNFFYLYTCTRSDR